MANSLLVLAHAAAEHGAAHAEPVALGLTPPMWVALSMATLIGIAVFLKVPGMLTSGLDTSIISGINALLNFATLDLTARARRDEEEFLATLQ